MSQSSLGYSGRERSEEILDDESETDGQPPYFLGFI